MVLILKHVIPIFIDQQMEGGFFAAKLTLNAV